MDDASDGARVGYAVLLLRRARGEEQQALARRSGVTKAWLSLLERGKIANPGRKNVDAVAQGLGIRNGNDLLRTIFGHDRYAKERPRTRGKGRRGRVGADLPPPAGIAGLCALYNDDEDRVWAGAILEDGGRVSVVACSGIRGELMRDQVYPMTSRAGAEAFLAGKISPRLARGWVAVDFRDPAYGLLEPLRRLLPSLPHDPQALAALPTRVYVPPDNPPPAPGAGRGRRGRGRGRSGAPPKPWSRRARTATRPKVDRAS